VVEDERRQATAEAGRDKDRAIKEEAYEAYHYHKHLQGKYAYGADKLTTRDETLSGIKSSQNADFLRTLENDPGDSFEAESLKNAGFG
jgi:hypothetical protein